MLFVANSVPSKNHSHRNNLLSTVILGSASNIIASGFFGSQFLFAIEVEARPIECVEASAGAEMRKRIPPRNNFQARSFRAGWILLRLKTKMKVSYIKTLFGLW